MKNTSFKILFIEFIAKIIAIKMLYITALVFHRKKESQVSKDMRVSKL